MRPKPYRGPRSAPSPAPPQSTQTEAQAQIELVRILDAAAKPILFSATANGGKRDKRTAAALKKQGVKPGLPDLLIFTPPPNGVGVGLAIELKRARASGKQRGRVSAHQEIWLEELRSVGWRAEVAYGLDHALEILTRAGYDLSPLSEED